MKKLNTCKKLISSILVVALLSLGCSDIVHITKKEFNEGYFEDGEKSEIYVTTKDSLHYHFLDYSYYIQYDSLCGDGNQLDLQEERLPFDGKIAMENIESIERKEMDVVMSSVVAVVLIATLIIAIVVINEIAESIPDFKGFN